MRIRDASLKVDVLRKLETGKAPEYVYKEPDRIRYFRPIKLSEDCLLCPGDPAGSVDPVVGIVDFVSRVESRPQNLARGPIETP